MIQDSRKLLRALDNLTNETIHAEQYFADELHLFFQYLCRKLLKELDLKNPLDSLFHLEPNNIIEKYWKEYEKIFSYYVDVGATIGNIHYDILLNASKAHAKEFASTKSRETVQSLLDYKFNSEDTDTLFKPDPKVSSRLKRYKFEASEKTKARVTEDINNILGEAYREGWGPRHVGEKIQERFNQLSGYEARRIAQTELNTTRNMVQYNRLKDDEMPYKIWHSAHDARTRKSHLDVDEEIVPIDEKFSNGLMYPGDKSGPIREWVNCRCSHAAFVMPLGYEAPSFFPFRESDLVKVGSSVSSSYIPELRERLGLVEGLVQGAVTERQRQRVAEEPIVEPKPVKPKVEKPKPVKVYEDVDKGKPIMVYEYEDYTIGMHKNVKYTDIDEITTHLDNLPKELLNHNSKIYVMDVPEPKGNAGTFTGLPGGDVRLWDMRKTFKDDALKKTVEMTPMDVLTHELAHAVDYSIDSFQLKYSFPKDYEKIVKSDNKLYSYINENTGRRRTPDVFPTSYAGRSFFKKKRDSFVKFERYIEDFAESTKLYLNPKYHKEFCDTFPNRAQYLEKIYGKPKF